MTQRTESATGAVVQLPLDAIRPDPQQPRRTFDQTTLDDLANDIRANGVLQPIRVRRDADGDWVIVIGERRWRAAKNAGLESIPAMLDEVAESDPLERALRQLAENYHREALGPMDLAEFLYELKHTHKLAVPAISALLTKRGFRHMGRSYVSNTIRLRTLPQRYQNAIAAGDLAPTTAQYLLQMISMLGSERSGEVLDLLDREAELHELSALEFRDTLVELVSQVVVPLDREKAALPPKWLSDEGYRLEFDPATCTGCKSLKKWTVDGEVKRWCANLDGFRAKQAAARQDRYGQSSETPDPEPLSPGAEADFAGSEFSGEMDEGDPDKWEDDGDVAAAVSVDTARRARKISIRVLDMARAKLVEAFECPSVGVVRSAALLRWLAAGASVRDKWSPQERVTDLFDFSPPIDFPEVLPEEALLAEQHCERATRPSSQVQILGDDSVWSWVVALDLYECTLTEQDVADIDPEFSDLVLEEATARWKSEIQVWLDLRKTPQPSSSDPGDTAAATVSP